MIEFNYFKIKDIFSKPGKGDVDLQQSDINGKGEYFINSGETNYGIKGKTNRSAKIFPANTITIDFWGNAYYRDFRYKLATHNHVFSFNDPIIKNKNIGLYLVGALQFLKHKYSYSNMLTWNKLKKESIYLPVISKTNDINFEYMENRVKALEQDRVKALANYLTITGLDNYKLTKDDKNILSTLPRTKSFTIGELMVGQTGDVDIQNKDISDQGEWFINSGVTNRGIKGKTTCKAKIFPGNTITIDFFGNANYRSEPYKLATHNHVFSYSGDVIKNEKVGLYLVSTMRFLTSKYSYSNMATRKSLKDETLELPIDTQDNIDFKYMEYYITAIQKLTIKNVIKYKDEVINKTKEIIN
ncbi:hypothetical protein E5350_08240 [Lactobacillus johnsonii]|uniref:restriction endonuclease subunit S n=1 Tax=Lactobacillus johnsonii TaxID=33959 RepID=UPI0010937988|nr:restriction endonuclease subunit S [Lactobacillus johnsonii]TGY26103.1 hypothetical protein E5350_08240 [Lactobacillus johnsonii]